MKLFEGANQEKWKTDYVVSLHINSGLRVIVDCVWILLD